MRDAGLFDPERQSQVEARGRRIGYLGSLAGGILFAVIFWFVAGHWWLSLALFFSVSFLMTGTTWLVTRNPSPTVTCLGCGKKGWIDDLQEATGACPSCGSGKFSYYRFRGDKPALVEAEIDGAELVERRSSTGMPWI